MGRRKQYHNHSLPALLNEYAESRTLDFHQYSEYHMRLMDGGMTCLDIWTTEKYWIKETNYVEQKDPGTPSVTERGGEKGFVPSKNPALTEFLDTIFFAVELR